MAIAAHAALVKDVGAYTELRTRALENFEKSKALAPNNPGVYAVIAVTWATITGRLPADQRRDAWEWAYMDWKQVRTIRTEGPAGGTVHGRGELLMALAHAAAHLDLKQESASYLESAIAELPGTDFEMRARQELRQPTLAKQAVSCQSCHEPGRLANQPGQAALKQVVQAVSLRCFTCILGELRECRR